MTLAQAQVPNSLKWQLEDPRAGHLSFYGKSVAVSGNWVVIGSPNEDTGGKGTGSAYIYDLSSPTSAKPAIVLHNPRAKGNEAFGYTVAISGTWVAIGVPESDDETMRDVGRVEIYNLAGSAPARPVMTVQNPTPQANDNFGWSLGFADGWLVVGAPKDDTGAIDAGCVYLYNLASETPTQPAETLSNPAPDASDNFGVTVAAAGEWIAVGSHDEKNPGSSIAGRVYLYNRSLRKLTKPTIVLRNPSPDTNNRFGSVLALSADRLAVGAPFERNGLKAGGTVFVYDLWYANAALSAVLMNPGSYPDERFGLSLGVAGKLVVVGLLTSDGKAYLYDMESAAPTKPVATLGPPYPGKKGFSHSVAIDAGTVVVGALDESPQEKGAASVFRAPTENGSAADQPTAVTPPARQSAH